MPEPTTLDTSALRRIAIGSLMRSARERAGRTPRECAAFMGVTPKRLADFEAGAREPSLVDLELLAHCLDVPVAALLSEAVALPPRREISDLASVAQLRARIIGVRLRQARMDRRESLKEVAAATGLKASELNAFELGRRPAPITQLEKLVAHYGLSIDELLDLGIGQLGEAQLLAKQQAAFNALPDEVKAFAGGPDNAQFMRLAAHLSQMPREQLRAAAALLAAAGGGPADE